MKKDVKEFLARLNTIYLKDISEIKSGEHDLKSITVELYKCDKTRKLKFYKIASKVD